MASHPKPDEDDEMCKALYLSRQLSMFAIIG
jgi:hypothetical protein